MDKKRQLFLKALKKENEITNYDFELKKRSCQAKININNLMKETEELKAERPKLLAEGIDVSELCKRLREIEEEIEINQDTISGIEEKRKSLKLEIFNIKQDTRENFQNFIEEILQKVEIEYTKTSKKLALIIKEYITLENIYYGEMNYIPKINSDDIRRLRNLNNNKPIFENKNYDICRENDDIIRKKYQISDYYVRNLRLS